MYIFTLTLHILGALVSFYFIFQALFVVLRGQKAKFINLFRYIALSALFEVVTGITLFLSQLGSASLIHFCARITIYLVIVGSIEILLYFKIHRSEIVASSPL